MKSSFHKTIDTIPHPRYFLKMSAYPDVQNDASLTPLMRQYFSIKADYPDAILFFHLGDFFEMFYDDAIIAAKILDLTLTSRNKNQENSTPLCGVPVHTADGYIARLVQAGKKVVVCEQVEDPKTAKGLVKRAVTRVVSPGMVFEEATLSAKANNYLMAIHPVETGFCFALTDASTGTLRTGSVSDAERLREIISLFNVREIVYAEKIKGSGELKKVIPAESRIYHHSIADLYFSTDYAREQLLLTFQVAHTSALGLDGEGAQLIPALGGIIGVLNEAKLLRPGLLSHPVPMHFSKKMQLDEVTLAHLEITSAQNIFRGEGTLLRHMDQCQTVMGSRYLVEWLTSPLFDVGEITRRHESVAELTNDGTRLEGIRSVLSQLPDFERLANRFLAQAPGPRELTSLAAGLSCLPELRLRAGTFATSLLKELTGNIVFFPELVRLITTTLIDDPPLSSKEGGFVRDGVSSELDELRALEKDSKGMLAQMEVREKQRTGISSLKVRFNSVFGYYIEITHTHRDKVPADYIRKQTLTNAERYITEELKTFEQKILSAAERIRALEASLLADLRLAVQNEVAGIKKMAQAIASIDILTSFAHTAKKHDYTCPQMLEKSVLDLVGASHPVLAVNSRDEFVTNDIFLSSPETIQLMITGPNMAGKSTLMRMTALIVIMAHAGSFVPCAQARIGITDRIFTRVGAHDNLHKGMSTFMVEMVETAKILREATEKSLVLLDEIGRGTSTFDGLSIAWAVAEDLHDRIRARTLFATHYHELCDLAEKCPGISNHTMSVKEWNGQVIFMRKLVKGSANRSYGVVVAGMAGLPRAVVGRAREILALLEEKDMSFQSELKIRGKTQMSLFDTQEKHAENIERVKSPQWLHEFRETQFNNISPLQALNLLARWQDEDREAMKKS